MLNPHRLSVALSAACLSLSVLGAVLAPPALAAGPATVTVRVEGVTETKLPPTVVTTTTSPVVKDGNPEHACSGTSAAGALEVATHGSWSGTWFKGLGYAAETIEGESFPFTGSEFWEIWLDNKPATAFCGAELNPGDSLLFFPECFSETAGQCPPSPNPLGIEAPLTAERGQPVAVSVLSYNHASGATSPAAHVALSYPGATAETDTGGHATLTFAGAGEITVRASAPESVRTETTICVHNGNDGSCGTSAPSVSTPSSQSGATGAVAGAVARYTGPYALVAGRSDVIDGHVYPRGRAPRVIAGSMLAHNAVTSVSLELRREYRGRCFAYDGTSERFRRARCGTGRFFQVATGGTFSYLLPEVLRPGRYVLDLRATDVAGNSSTLARGTSRLVFYVR